jgi:erythromycin esterase-like protein
MTTTELAHAIRHAAEPLSGIDDPDLDPLLERIGSARVVLLGEASHGTSEFYRLRTAITRALVERAGFRIVAVEADWPDAARVDRHIRDVEVGQTVDRPFTRFPTWMWANQEVAGLVSWLRHWNEDRDPEDRTGFHGLDLYSMHGSVEAVLDYLDDVDADAASLARARYGCLSAWQDDPAAYGHAAVTGRFEGCASEVAAMLGELLQRRMKLEAQDGVRTFDAIQNARLVSNAEQYYRVMYQGSTASWNLRDRHMFETLEALLDHRGEGARAVVWAHNSHLGNAAATEMGQRGQINIGSQARERFGDGAYLIGFGTDRGTVAAADDWGGPMQVMDVRPARDDSYEGLMRETGSERFLLPLRTGGDGDGSVREGLMEPRLERAIGVIYRPRTERQSHYFDAVLPRQFDEYVWLAETEAVTPIRRTPADRAEAETFPFGL